MARLAYIAAVLVATVLLLAPAAFASDIDASRVLDESASPFESTVDWDNMIELADSTQPISLIQQEMSTRGFSPEEDKLMTTLLQTEVEGETEQEAEQLVEQESEQESEAESESEQESEQEAEQEAEQESETESESESESENESEQESEAEEGSFLETSEEPAAEGGAGSANPTYALPFPPIQPHYYSPLFNPYTNVNPLSYPYANYAAQPGTHPGLAQASASYANTAAARNAAVAHAGAFPYYPYVGGGALSAAAANGLYSSWIHPQNMNSAKVGDNTPAEFPQFVEISAEGDSCVNCKFN